MPEIRHIAFYIITSRKGDDMKQGVFWVIDNKLLAIPFDKNKYPDVVIFDGYPFAYKTFSLILSTGDNQDCCSLWNLYWAGPRTWKTGAVKHGEVGYISRGKEFVVSPLYNAKRYNGKLTTRFKLFDEIKQAFGDDEQKYYELDSIISAKRITEDEIRSFINSEVHNGEV